MRRAAARVEREAREEHGERVAAEEAHPQLDEGGRGSESVECTTRAVSEAEDLEDRGGIAACRDAAAKIERELEAIEYWPEISVDVPTNKLRKRVRKDL